MTARLPDPARSRAVLIGSAHYRHLADLPAVDANLTAIRDLLTHPVLGGFAPWACTIVDNLSEPKPVRALLRRHARDTEDTFLVYFAGHGLLGTRNELHLALADTDTDDLAYTALAFDQVREVLLDCPARNRVVILDCCFAGAALPPMTDPAGAIAGQTVIEGSYILVAAPATKTALAPPGARYTAFTAALLERLTIGIPDGPELITLADLYPRLRATLTARGLPQPHQHGSDTITGLALTRNPAHHPPTINPPASLAASRVIDLTGADPAAQHGPISDLPTTSFAPQRRARPGALIRAGIAAATIGLVLTIAWLGHVGAFQYGAVTPTATTNPPATRTATTNPPATRRATTNPPATWKATTNLSATPTTITSTAPVTPEPVVHQCVVRVDASLWCWGGNQRGQLGNGSRTAASAPVRVSSGGAGDRWLAVSVGAQSTCAMRTDALLWCWGDNSAGQLGDGTTTARSTPVRVSSPAGWLAVSVGTHTCAVRSDHTLWCWGAGEHGELGDGTSARRLTPGQVGAETTWVAVTVAEARTCAVRENGSTECWGATG